MWRAGRCGTELLTSLGREAVAPGPGKCFSRSPQKACSHPALALCLHGVCFKSFHHTEKGMS